MYRWKETAKQALRLAYIMGDLSTEIHHFCEANHLEISDGMDNLMGDAESLLAKIKETQTIPIAELLRRPPTQLRPNAFGQGDDSEDQTGSGQNLARFRALRAVNRCERTLI
jgi:hypothetical protein